MDTITIAFNDTPSRQIEAMDGVIMSVPWDALKETIAQSVRLRDDEIIDGLLVNNVEIRVKISRKKGRKIKA